MCSRTMSQKTKVWAFMTLGAWATVTLNYWVFFDTESLGYCGFGTQIQLPKEEMTKP